MAGTEMRIGEGTRRRRVRADAVALAARAGLPPADVGALPDPASAR